jgi:hypothetical protein
MQAGGKTEGEIVIVSLNGVATEVKKKSALLYGKKVASFLPMTTQGKVYYDLSEQP